MKDYFIQYKPFLFFLGRFFLTYLLLTIIYQSYLSQFDARKLEVDQFTYVVAKQSEMALNFFGGHSEIMPHESQPCYKLFYNGDFVARVVEGCNALSVMILFVAFVVAFKGKWKHVILFVLAGCVLIHVLNVARIAILAAAIFHFPECQDFLHGVIFPLFIYSVVFILWVIWVNKFSEYAKKPVRA